MPACPNCGTDNPDRARFCLECGRRLAEETTAGHESRRTVTVLFGDVVGSTALGERSTRRRCASLWRATSRDGSRSSSATAGRVEKFIGDAIMAVFGLPTSTRTTPCAPSARRSRCATRLSGLNAELEAERGVAIRLGPASTRARSWPATRRRAPDARHRATRSTPRPGSSRRRRPGEILIGELDLRAWSATPSTRGGRRADRGEGQGGAGAGLPAPRRSGPAPRASASPAGAARRPRRGARDAPRGLRRVVAERRLPAGHRARAGRGRQEPPGRRVPGRRRAPTATASSRSLPAATARASPTGRSREIVHAAAGIADADAARRPCAKLVAAARRRRSDAADRARRLAERRRAQRDEVCPARRDLLGGPADASRRSRPGRPLVVVVEDIHWAEPDVARSARSRRRLGRDAPLLLLCPARPEPLDLVRRGVVGVPRRP